MGKRIKKKTMDIPTEIMEEILYKLPVKTLLRFECVSKSWLSLISSRYFIRQHLKKSSNDDDTDSKDLTFDDSQHIIFQYYKTSFFSLGSCRLPGEPIDKTNFGYYYGTGDSGRSVRIVGSYNGLILITFSSMYNLLLLWNPSTGKAKDILPPASFHEADQLGQTDLYSWGDFRYFLFGFGYDELRDEYKVVCIKVPTWRAASYQTQIYCSSTDSWKKMEVFDKGFPCHRTVFLNGRFHWMAKKGYSDCEIVSLDLVDEKYRIVPHPETFTNFHGQKLVELLGGYLSVMCETSDTDTNVWAMMEYGKIESWTKIWTLSDFVSSPCQRYLLSAKPLYLNKNGDITVAFGSNVVVYSGKNEVHRSRVDMLDAKPESILYVESLVSLTYS